MTATEKHNRPDIDPIWKSIRQRDRMNLINRTLFEPLSDDRLQFPFLNEIRCIDLKKGCVLREKDGQWLETDDPLLSLAAGIYLQNIDAIYPLGQDIVGVKDLKEGHFFVGPHELRVHSICQTYGRDLTGFKRAAEFLKGTPLDMADAAYRFLPFPRVPLYYLLWLGDDEFGPRVDVLFDRSIEKTFPADAIWGLVSRVSAAFMDKKSDLTDGLK